MAHITLKVIGTKHNTSFPTNEDIRAYLVKHGVIPQFYTELAWLYPYSSGAAQRHFAFGCLCHSESLPDTWAKQLEHKMDDTVGTWAFLDTANSFVIVVSDCDAEDEGVIATFYRQKLVKESGYADEDIEVLFSDMPDPVEITTILGNIAPVGNRVKSAKEYLTKYLGTKVKLSDIVVPYQTDTRVEVYCKFEYMGKPFTLEVENDEGKIEVYVRDNDTTGRHWVKDPANLRETMLESFFYYGGAISNALGSQCFVSDWHADDAGECVIFDCDYKGYKLRASVVPAIEEWHAEVLTEAGESLGFTDECGVRSGTLDKQVEAIIKHDSDIRPTKDYTKDINALLNGNAVFAEGTPSFDREKNEVTYEGYYDRCPAKFIIKPDKGWEVRVIIYDPDNDEVFNDVVNDTHRPYASLASAVAKCKGWKKKDIPVPATVTPEAVANLAERLRIAENCIANLQDDLKTIREHLNLG